MPSLYHCEQQHAERVASLDAILAAAKGRNLTGEEQARFNAITAECVTLEREIDEVHNARVPARPDAGQAAAGTGARDTGSDVRDPADLESMRSALRAMGITARDDPGAGLPPAQASMARTLAAQGIKPNLPGLR